MVNISFQYQHESDDILEIIDSDNAVLVVDGVKCYLESCRITEESTDQVLYTTHEKPTDLPDGQHYRAAPFGYQVYTYATVWYHLQVEIPPQHTINNMTNALNNPEHETRLIFDNGSIHFPRGWCSSMTVQTGADEDMWITADIRASPDYEVEIDG